MRGNSQVRFLGGWVGAIPPGYPTGRNSRHSMVRVLKVIIAIGFLAAPLTAEGGASKTD